MSKKVSGWPLIAPTEVDTSITGDQVLEALATDVEASDSGKVLTATYGGLEGEETGSVMWASPLPFIGEGDAGKVLTVNAGETGAEWAAAGGGDSIPVIHLIADDQGNFTHDGTFEGVWGLGDNATVKVSFTGDFTYSFVGALARLAKGEPPVPVKIEVKTFPLLFRKDSQSVRASYDEVAILADNSVTATNEYIYLNISE